VRVATQAIEFLGSGHVTFPLPNAAHVLAIKTGQIAYQDVSREIEGLLEKVEAASVASTLPDDPDLEWIDDFIGRVYRAEICRS
jgi:hypothetical protein